MTNTTTDSMLLRAIMDAAVDAIIIANSKGQIIRLNSSAAELFGYNPKELVGQSLNSLMPGPMASLHDGFIEHYLSTGEKKIIGIGRDLEGVRKDGSTFALHLSVGTADLGEDKLFVGILHDLTERNAAKEALARSQRLDAIGQMTGGIAHDFNNLLTVIMGNLELLEMTNDDDRTASLIKDSLEATELGADLIARLLVFARKGDLKPVLSDLSTVCENALSILGRTLGANYRIATEFSPDLHKVSVDPVQLQSSLINLALNAKDAMPDSGTLTVALRNIDIDDAYIAQETNIEPGTYVRLTVSDTGKGMPKEIQRRVFEPFFSTKKETGGSGLGLAMVYGFVRQSGGHVTVYSEPNVGTNFSLYFPAIRVEQPSQASTVGKLESPSGLIGEGRSVLVVEDDERVRRLSVRRMADLGFVVHEAETGDRAYEMLRENSNVTLVFTDLVMPGTLNGLELAKKSLVEFPHIKIILTSGYASTIETDNTNLEILQKPFRVNELVERLNQLFDATQS